MDDLIVEYPGPPLLFEFYKLIGDTEPSGNASFPEPWGCLRMLRQGYDERRKGRIKLTVKDGALIVTSWDHGPIFQRQLPLSETRFQSVGGLATIDLEFDDIGVMHMYENGRKFDSFHPVELFAPDIECLSLINDFRF